MGAEKAAKEQAAPKVQAEEAGQAVEGWHVESPCQAPNYHALI